jgi:hypothetical protein
VCNQRVAFARNERTRMQMSCVEKVFLLEAENKNQIEFSKDSNPCIRLHDPTHHTPLNFHVNYHAHQLLIQQLDV